MGFVVAVLRGQDGNWDLQNYHLYNPFALIGGRLGIDLMPAGIQSFFNPLLDVPYYLLAQDLLPDRPRLVCGLAGLPYGVLVFLTWCVSRRVLPHAGLALVAALVGASGTITAAEIGTSFGDIPMADLLLAALLGVLTRGERPWGRLGAGVLAGAAAGLKPTNAVFVLALFLAQALPLVRQPRRAVSAAALFSLGVAGGVVLTDGWWALILYRAFGNPVAPFLNGLFRSPWFPTGSNVDVTYLPHTILQAVFFPFFWLSGRHFVVAEISVRDARFAAAYLAVVGLAVTAIAGRRDLRIRLALAPTTTRPSLILLAFWVAGFALWEAAFSIIRYAVVLEALTGIVLMQGLVVFGRLRLMPRRAAAWLGGAAVVFVLAFGNYADWGRVRKLGDSVFKTPVHALPPDSLVVLTGAPRGFLALFLRGPEVAFIGLAGASDGTRMQAAALARMAAHAGPIFLVDNTMEAAPDLSAWGLRRDPAPCVPLPSAYQRGLRLCPAARLPRPPNLDPPTLTPQP